MQADKTVCKNCKSFYLEAKKVQKIDTLSGYSIFFFICSSIF